jgi:hypothetical protein
MLDCGICLTNPTSELRVLDFLERGVEAHGRVDLCFPSALPLFVCRSRVSRPRGGGWLALACARVGGGRSSLCGGVWGFLPLCNCYAMNQPASQPRAHSTA